MKSTAPIIECKFAKFSKKLIGAFIDRRFIKHNLNGAADENPDRDEYWLFGIELDREDYWKFILNNNTEFEIAIAVFKYITEDTDYSHSKKYPRRIELFLREFYSKEVCENFRMMYL